MTVVMVLAVAFSNALVCSMVVLEDEGNPTMKLCSIDRVAIFTCARLRFRCYRRSSLSRERASQVLCGWGGVFFVCRLLYSHTTFKQE